MEKEELKNIIAKHFKTRRDFIKSFNESGGDLDETVLANQLGGRRGISKGWASAYSIFFNLLNKKSSKG